MFPPDAAIAVTENLRYRYRRNAGEWVLDDINLTIEPGSYVLLCGASGSGKSTLARTFNGLIPHFYEGEMAGRVWVAGRDTREHPVSELCSLVAMVFQNADAQLFTSSVERELAFGLESLGLKPAEIQQRIEESAAAAGILPLLARNPRSLSGGEQQLVIIAAALALRPKLLVLDEPYASLDPCNVRRVRQVLRKAHREGTTIVLSEHRLQHALAEADRMVVLHQGRVALDGPPRRVLAQDVTPYGLNVPPVVRQGRAYGMPVLPLSVKEFADNLNSQRDALPPRTSNSAPAVDSSAPPAVSFAHVSALAGGATLLHDISLDVRQGECLAIVGANGAGKTTLIKHMNGLLRPDSGSVCVLGQDTRRAKVSQIARQVGLAFQNPNDQFFKFRVWDEIAAGARALQRYDEDWIRSVVALFRLEPLLERSPYRLSEGEKKRVAFAAALAARPAILVLDEPTAGQDDMFRGALGDMLANLRAHGQTVVIVTHDLEFAEQHANRWLLLAQGRVLREGSPDTIMADGEAMRQAALEPTQRFRLATLTQHAPGEEVVCT
jgi:energy-coupling factor transport system ATP-binding protein